MVEGAPHRAEHLSLVVGADQPLIGLIFEEDGREVVRYFADEREADAALADQATAEALALAGAWRHMDWDELADSLDRIRHESEPTPPIEL